MTAADDTLLDESAEPPIRVMLVDDHPIVRGGLRQALEEDERLLVVAEIGTGREAIKAAGQLLPDVTVMDINLPDITGLEATRAIKEAHPEIRILIVSSHDDEEWVVGALEAGADGYLLKQSAPRELREGVLTVFAGERVLHPTVMRAVIARATRPPAPPPAEELSGREREILQMLAAGATSKEIAISLRLSPKTVENHRARILDKLEAPNSAAAVRTALAKGLIKPAEGAKSGPPRFGA
ncbi:MAG: response regulator transcription factor [Chloroflexota bacterium]|nr:response regulator transcription factor [Chloroflexota bacterium]